MAPRICFIGGGSYQWTPKLILDIADTPSLSEAEIVIEDIDPKPIPEMVELIQHIATIRGTGMTATGTTNQTEALAGADYVIVCISTGALTSMEHDLTIPQRFGIYQSVGDTIGPGGIMRALRNIPVMVDIAADMQRVCPDAWLLNLTNPMTTLTRAVHKATNITALGLCHEVVLAKYTLSLLLGCDMRDIDAEIAGVNHLPFITRLRIGEHDGFELLHDLFDDVSRHETQIAAYGLSARKPASSGFNSAGDTTVGSLLGANALKFELFKRFGVLPAAGDRHVAEFFSGFLTQESGWGMRWGIELTSMENRRAWLAYYEGEAKKMRQAATIPREPSGEMVATIIDARSRDKTRHLPLNIANHGQVPDLPDGVVVESMVTVDASGLSGRDVAALPAPVAETVRRISAEQELVVQAGIAGNRDLAIAAMRLDPLCSRLDYDELHRMADEMFTATAEWLPQFS